MKNLTQFILESHSWEPEDTDNISEFLSYLFFICKEQYNNAHNITLVAVKDNNGNIKINIKNAITNVDLICDTITN